MIEKRALLLIACMFTASRTRDAYAQDASEPLHFHYEAPSICPARETFVGEVLHASHARKAKPDEAAREIVVRIEALEEGYEGKLSIREHDTESTPRSLQAGSCTELVSALALVAALSIDPNAGASAAPEEPSAPPAPIIEAKPAAPPPPHGTVAPAPVVSIPPTHAAPTATPSSTWRFSVGAGAEVSSLVRGLVSLRVMADLERRRPGIFSPALRLGFARSLPASIGNLHEASGAPIAGARARFTQTLAQLEGCPIRLDLTAHLAFRPCAAFAAGALAAAPRNVAQATSRTRPWSSLGAAARLAWSVLDVLDLEVEGGALAPFVRETFVFAPHDVEIYRAPPVAAFGRVGLLAFF